MTRSSFTAVLLGGALAGACSKPNPLFLDTWGVVTDSGSNSETTLTAGSIEPTTVEPPVTETTDPPTTTTSTVTSSSEVGTSDVTPGTTTETTGDPFFCDVDNDGCCTVDIAVEADSFFSDAQDLVGLPGCPLVPDQPPPLDMLPCTHWSFGLAKEMRFFNDDEGKGNEAIIGKNVLALRFPMSGEQLTYEGEAIPTAQIDSIALVLTAVIDWATYSDLTFSIHGIDAGQTWSEGPAPGEMVPCKDGLASFGCRECGATPEDCTAAWAADLPMATFGEVPGPQGQNAGQIELDLTTIGAQEVPVSEWLAKASGSLVVVPSSSKFDGEPHPQVPVGAIKLKTLDGGAPAILRARLCEK